MALNWDGIAVAVACRVQYEQACGRGRLITEEITRSILAEVVQIQVAGSLEAEYNHPDISGKYLNKVKMKLASSSNGKTSVTKSSYLNPKMQVRILTMPPLRVLYV